MVKRQDRTMSDRDTSTLKVRPHQMLCAVCAAAGCRHTPAGRRVTDRIRKTIKTDPYAMIELAVDLDVTREHYNAAFAHNGRRLQRADFHRRSRDYANRMKDLEIMRRLGLSPNGVYPARDVVVQMFTSIETLEGICFHKGRAVPGWPECPHARKNLFRKVRAKGAGKDNSISSCRRLGEALQGKGIYSLLPIRTRREMQQAKKESCKRIASADRLFVRPHHLMCMACHWGLDNMAEPPAEDNLHEVLLRMQTDPDIPVTLVEGPCMVCDPCPGYYPEKHMCLYMFAKDQLKDLMVLRKLGLKPGDALPAKALYRLLFRRVRDVKEICGWGGTMQDTSPLWHHCPTCEYDYYPKARDHGLVPGPTLPVISAQPPPPPESQTW